MTKSIPDRGLGGRNCGRKQLQLSSPCSSEAVFVSLVFGWINPLQESRYDVGFFNWIPADQRLWCYSKDARLLRDVQLTFELPVLTSMMGDDCDCSRVHEPLLIVYDSRVTKCARMLADVCLDHSPHDRLYSEGITLALLAAILNASVKGTEAKPTGGLTPWQVRIAKEVLELASLMKWVCRWSRNKRGCPSRALLEASKHQRALLPIAGPSSCEYKRPRRC
jgi:hypothetical protein